MRPRRLLAILLGLGMLTTLFPLATPGSALPMERVLVHGVGAAGLLEARGLPVLDDYGAFATADALPADVRALLADSVVASALPTTTGRGEYRFDARAGDGVVPRGWRSEDSAYSLVAFRGPVKAEWRAALAALGPIYDYLPFNSYIVRADRAGLEHIEGVEFVGVYHAGYKLEPGLEEAQGAVRVTVLAWPDADLGQVQRDLASLGARVLEASLIVGLEGLVKVEVDASALRAVAGLEAVSYVERSILEYGFDNEKATGIIQDGNPAARAVSDKGIDGSSQVLSVCDTGVNTVGSGDVRPMQHDMFHDPVNPSVTFQQANPLHRKVLLYYAPVENGVTKGDFNGASHGTHTAGTVAGDVAPYNAGNLHDAGPFAAKLAICDVTIGISFQLPNAYRVQWDPAYDVGARINSNSWGGTHTNLYTDPARQHDAYTWERRDFTILRSAGNTGPGGLIRPEAIAKNILTVGSSKNDGSGNIEDLSGFSSRGPAGDGRIKPDLVAPGECLNSAATNANGYSCLSGTSMATPTAAAAAGLVRDYFSKGFYPGGLAGSGPSMDPSNALVRATLFASGHEMTGAATHAGIYHPATANAIATPFFNGLYPAGVNSALGTAYGNLYGQVLSRLPPPLVSFPNGNIGWGRITLDDALFFAGDGRDFVAIDEGEPLATGEQTSFTFTVDDTEQRFRVMLVWTDHAGAAGANPALVNNLDLSVTAPDGSLYLGNNFLGADSLASGVPDLINNAEAVSFGAPAAGTYTVTVTGTNVPQGPQPFALVVVGGLV